MFWLEIAPFWSARLRHVIPDVTLDVLEHLTVTGKHLRLSLHYYLSCDRDAPPVK